jgi:hypothetical protein
MGSSLYDPANGGVQPNVMTSTQHHHSPPGNGKHRSSHHHPGRRHHPLLQGALTVAGTVFFIIGFFDLLPALVGKPIQHTSGAVAEVDVSLTAPARGGVSYNASTLLLQGISTHFQIVRDEFEPQLPGGFYYARGSGARVELWHYQGFLPPFDPILVAMGIYLPKFRPN